MSHSDPPEPITPTIEVEWDTVVVSIKSVEVEVPLEVSVVTSVVEVEVV
jgi:hypothetical protein